MTLKIFRAGWFTSVMAVLAALLYAYSSLPEDVVLLQESTSILSVPRETFFYIALALITLINVLVYVIAFLFGKDETFRSWFHGLIVTLNIFVIISLQLLNVINSAEKFNYGSIAILIYGSLVLIMMWALAWPAYVLYRKFFPKLSV